MTSISCNGFVTYWSLAGNTLWETLATELGKLGQKAPPFRTAEHALKLALRDVFPGTNELIRPVTGGGYSVVREDRSPTGNTYTTLAVVQIAMLNGHSRRLNITTDLDCGQALHDAWTRQSALIDGAAMTPMLTASAMRLNAVRLRETGGIYWLPADAYTAWSNLADCFERAGSNRIYKVRSVADDDTLNAVFSALVAEIRDETDALTMDLLTGGALAETCPGKKAVETRQTRVAGLRQKLTRYAAILGMPLGELERQVNEADATITAALGLL